MIFSLAREAEWSSFKYNQRESYFNIADSMKSKSGNLWFRSFCRRSFTLYHLTSCGILSSYSFPSLPILCYISSGPILSTSILKLSSTKNIEYFARLMQTLFISPGCKILSICYQSITPLVSSEHSRAAVSKSFSCTLLPCSSILNSLFPPRSVILLVKFSGHFLKRNSNPPSIFLLQKRTPAAFVSRYYCTNSSDSNDS